MKSMFKLMTSVLALAACTPPASDPGAELASLRAAASEYHDAASSKNADAVVDLYDGSSLMVPPNGELVDGLDAVRGYRFGFIETPGVALDFELVRAEVSAAGDMGWTLAIGQITIDRDDGTVGREVVRDFHTWRKQSDGSWRVVVDMWNSGPTPD